MCLVSAADKLHNVRSIIRDYHEHGDAIWDRFQGSRDGTLWYYETVADTLIRRYRSQLTRDLQDEVDKLLELTTTNKNDRPSVFVFVRMSRRRRRRHALLRRLLERVGDLDQLRLAALRADEADAERRRLRVEPGRERLLRRVRHHAERHRDDRIAGARGDARARSAGRDERIELVLP